jgi:Acyl-CoA thioesterase C-terminal domain/Acyl-CoA thioesterase N-terminal domain
VIESYFETGDGIRFLPTDYARGPWLAEACHAGPPAALMARAMEGAMPDQRLTRMTIDLVRPIPMGGFSVRAGVDKPGRQASLAWAELNDGDTVFARARGLHLRLLEDLDVGTAEVTSPRFDESVPGAFPVRATVHGLPAFLDSVECRFNDDSGSEPGGPTTMWMRTLVPIVAGEEPTPFQRICPLADCLNGISFNTWLDAVWFVNADLTVSLHRDPVGEWFCARAVSHWEPTGIGLAEAALFDVEGHVGAASQNLLLSSPGG